MMKVDLKKIIEGIEFQGDESQSYLKISTGEVVLFTDEAITAAESDEVTASVIQQRRLYQKRHQSN